MNFSRLEQNICDVLKEEQIKLGYCKETIRLYYPLSSLNNFLKVNLSLEQMQKVMKDFSDYFEGKIAHVDVTNRGERFCLCLSPEVSEYVYSNTDKDGFLYDFVNTVSRHEVTLDEIVSQFRKYSEHVCLEKVSNGEFDYLIYFEDGVPDSFRYCLSDEGHHFTYHRYTIEDYTEFGF